MREGGTHLSDTRVSRGQKVQACAAFGPTLIAVGFGWHGMFA